MLLESIFSTSKKAIEATVWLGLLSKVTCKLSQLRSRSFARTNWRICAFGLGWASHA